MFRSTGLQSVFLCMSLGFAISVSSSADVLKKSAHFDRFTEASHGLDLDQEISRQEEQIREILSAIKGEKTEVGSEEDHRKPDNLVKLTLITKK